MKAILLTLLFISVEGLFAATMTIKINNLPQNHPWEEPVYIAGDFNSWNPGSEAHKLTLNEDNTYSITLSGTGKINFKFTRGSWAKVEKGANCTELANRTSTFGSIQEYTAQVVLWADLCGGNHSAQPNVSILSDTFYIPQLDRNRRIWVYLPPEYDASQQKYPVIYMHDGQNLFDAFYSFAGEWEIDETLNKLFNENGQKCIIVGIDNGGTHRINEYSPWINPTYGGGEGDNYARFLVESLKPHIDSLFRTLPEREYTGIMGSSMGALISFYTGIKYQEIFSKIGIFSPSFWFSPQCYTFAAQTPKTENMKLYFLAGGQENGVTGHCIRMMDTLAKAGFTEEEMLLKTVPNGQHSEWFWRQEFRPAFEWLFSQSTGLENDKKGTGFVSPLFPNPTSGLVYIRSDRGFSGEDTEKNALLKSLTGHFIHTLPFHKNDEILTFDLSAYPDGLYILSQQFSCRQESRLVVKNSIFNSLR